MYELLHRSVQTAFGPEVPGFNEKMPFGVEGHVQVSIVVVEVVDVIVELVLVVEVEVVDVDVVVVVVAHEPTLGSAAATRSKLRTAS